MSYLDSLPDKSNNSLLAGSALGMDFGILLMLLQLVSFLPATLHHF